MSLHLNSTLQQMCIGALKKDFMGCSQLLFTKFCKLDIIDLLVFVCYSIFEANPIFCSMPELVLDQSLHFT